MKNSIFKKFLLAGLFFILVIFASFYLGFLYGLPKIADSKRFSNELIKFLSNKTGVNFLIKNFNIKTYPNLALDVYVENVVAYSEKGNDKIFSAENLYVGFYILRPKAHTLCAKYLYFNKPALDKLNLPKKTSVKKEFNVDKFPFISIKNADIILENNIEKQTSLKFLRFNIVPYKGKIISDTNINVYSNYLKNILNIGGKGQLIYSEDTLAANNFEIKSGIADFVVSGKISDKNKDFDLNIQAENLSVNKLENTFLTIMKRKNPEKNFIENFYDFDGLVNVNLRLKPKNITGTCKISNLSAKTVKYSIPIKLPKVVFLFDKDKIEAKTTGTFGGEETFTDFKAINIFDKSRVVSGNVISSLGSNFAKIYIPETDIKNKIDLSVKYIVKNRKPEVEYLAKIPVGSNIYYKSGDLGLEDKTRRIYAKTLKENNNLYLKEYDYSFVQGENVTSNIIHGQGLFIKKNNKFTMDYITCETDGDAPVSVTGSFGRYVSGGFFNGSLRYNYPKGIITGNFNVKDTRYKDFYVKSANVIADENIMEISSEGTLNGSPFTGYINLVNKFEDAITIHNIDLYLKKFVLHKNKLSNRKIRLKIPPKTKDIIWIVENGKIRLDELRFRKVLVENIVLTGNIKNNTVSISMPDIDFAKGKLSAKGTYNLSNHSSEGYFTAKNIDSNIAADMVLNLHEQIEGFADATAHVITKNKLEHIDAHATFDIKEGALTKLGSREFIIKKSKKNPHTIKFKLPDIINIDAKKIQALKSNLHGSFDICDDDIKNVEIYSQRKYLSTFTEGKYNIETQDAQIQVWGKYNKTAQKGIRILFVPLSMITRIIFRPEKTRDMYFDKINKIPTIDATPTQLEIFNVQAAGNINDTSKLKLKMKRIR